MGTVLSCLENCLELVGMKIVIFFIIKCDEDERVFGKRRCKRPKGNRGDIIYKGCKQYTCEKKDNFKNNYGWKESFASGKCCLIEDTGYPVGSVIFSETTTDGCTTSALSCENIGGIAKFRMMIKNMCPFCPTTPVFTTAAGYGNGSSSDWNFCSVSAPCSLGQGDCDSDAECANSLICGPDNCQDFDINADSAADCCIASVRGNVPRNNKEDKDEKDIKNKNDKDNGN